MMKYTLLYSLLGIGLLAGCSNEGTPSSDSETEHISFNITLDDVPATPITRTVSDMKFDIYGFRIAGYHTVGQFSGSGTAPTPNVFDKEPGLGAVPLVKKGTAGRYELPLAKLVLQDGTFLSFFAWAQNKTPDTTSGVIVSTNSSSQQGAPFLDIRVDDAPALQTDIVVSRFMNHHNSYVLSAVDLKFGHALSKLTFKARSSTGCKINFTKVNVIYTGSKVYRRAKFTFAATPGPATSDVDSLLGAYSDFSEYHSGAHALTTTYPTIAAGNNIASLGDMTLIPQNTTDGFCSLELTYDLATEAGVIEKSVTKIVPLKAIDLLRGKNYIYTLDITADKIELSHGLIAQWIDDVSLSGLPLIAGPRGDVLLLLDGSDPPYEHTNGKKYWLDRSGYNRHCEITGGNSVTYDSKKKSYVLNKPSKGFTIPSLGSPPSLTLDLIGNTTGSAPQIAFNLASSGELGQRRFFAHLGHQGTSLIYFDCGQKLRQAYSRVKGILNTLALVNKTAMYTFRYDPDNSLQTISRNGDLVFQKHYPANPGNTYGLGVVLDDNSLGSNFQGEIKYLKITQGVVATDKTKVEYGNLQTKYAIDLTGSEVEKSTYIADGLILNLDGKYSFYDSAGFWRDLSGNSFDAAVKTNGSLIHSNSGFSFQVRNIANYIYLGADETYTSLGNIQEYTIEFVAERLDSENSTLLFIGGTSTSNLNRAFAVNYPYGGSVEFDSPFGANGTNERIAFPIDAIPAHTTIQWSAVRKPSEYFRLYKNKEYQFSTTANSVLPNMNYFVIGVERPIGGAVQNPFSGSIHAIRIYKRKLTDVERAHNYNVDKLRYNQLP